MQTDAGDGQLAFEVVDQRQLDIAAFPLPEKGVVHCRLAAVSG